MLRTDNIVRYAKHHEGYFIGQPMNGQGTFGDWALANVLVQDAVFTTIEQVRYMTNKEISVMLRQPIMYWFVLAHPKINTAKNSWALLRFRFNPCAAATSTMSTSTPKPGDLSDKIAV